MKYMKSSIFGLLATIWKAKAQLQDRFNYETYEFEEFPLIVKDEWTLSAILYYIQETEDAPELFRVSLTVDIIDPDPAIEGF